jgi:hypothetical protein
MNGAERNIEIFKPFGEAFELMKKILFQPSDVKKWFVIGFAALLANLGGGGGGGSNYQYNRREDLPKLREAISQIPHPILVTGVCLGSRSHCSICLAARARRLHVYRLCRQEPRGSCRTMARISQGREQLFCILASGCTLLSDPGSVAFLAVDHPRDQRPLLFISASRSNESLCDIANCRVGIRHAAARACLVVDR